MRCFILLWIIKCSARTMEGLITRLFFFAFSVPDSPSMPKAFRGLAVRIEDEVLVGQTDYTVLSANCPKEVADVEAMCLNKLENRLQVAT